MQGKKKTTMSDAHVEEVAKLFSILSEPSRLKLLRALMERAMTVTELMEATDMKQGNVSKHMSLLLAARFVTRVQEGNFARYVLSDPTIYQLCTLMCGRIEQDVKRRARALA
jgi:DNA-binding transcriptional ArsR family regulator